MQSPSRSVTSGHRPTFHLMPRMRFEQMAALLVLLMRLIVFIGLHAIGNPVDVLIGKDSDHAERLHAIVRLGWISRRGARA